MYIVYWDVHIKVTSTFIYSQAHEVFTTDRQPLTKLTLLSTHHEACHTPFWTIHQIEITLKHVSTPHCFKNMLRLIGITIITSLYNHSCSIKKTFFKQNYAYWACLITVTQCSDCSISLSRMIWNVPHGCPENFQTVYAEVLNWSILKYSYVLLCTSFYAAKGISREGSIQQLWYAKPHKITKFTVRN